MDDNDGNDNMMGVMEALNEAGDNDNQEENYRATNDVRTASPPRLTRKKMSIPPKSNKRSIPRRHEWEMKTILLFITTIALLTKLKMTPPLDRVLQRIDGHDFFAGTKSYNNHANDPSPNSTATLVAASNNNSKHDCFIHPPIKVNYTTNQKSFQEGTLLLSTPQVCGSLRRDWSRFPVHSDLAREFERHQTNCSLPIISYEMDNSFGLGSHLVLWSQALCNAMEKGYRVRASNPQWLWMDKVYCDPERAKLSPLLCYFPSSELRCAGDEQIIMSTEWNQVMPDPRNKETFCKRLDQRTVDEGVLQEFRAASFEYMFQEVSPLIIKEAERQIGLLFSGERAPSDLITVHLRWGDKFFEMDLAPIAEYIAAINEILKQRGRAHNSTANIYLACEDPKAVTAFLEAIPSSWKAFVDRTFEELTPYRPPKGNRASWTAHNTKGRAGLIALGSLLVAMEANDFVLTTASNWSRLMNSLRRNVLDPRCGNCTRAIDLRPGTW